MRAPAARAPARQTASASAGLALRATARQPAVVGTPSTSTMSLTASRGPSPPRSSLVMNVLKATPPLLPPRDRHVAVRLSRRRVHRTGRLPAARPHVVEHLHHVQQVLLVAELAVARVDEAREPRLRR